MIKLFGADDRNFTGNGDVVITPLKAKIHKEDNGAFYLELETDLSYSDYLIENNILIAPTPQGEQAFRVGNVQKTGRKISTRAYHVFYDSRNYLIEDKYVYQKNCNDALAYLNSSTSDPSPFTVSSDVATVEDFRCVRNSLYEAVNTICERWGGHIVRDNWNLSILESIGQDNGETVRYAKNLKEISSEENWDGVVTKLLPVGKDGVLLNALDPSAPLYVYSNISYDMPYTKSVNFTQDTISEEDYRDSSGALDETAYKSALIADLKSQAQMYIDANSVPRVNYTLKANLSKITDVGDTVEVIDERLGINIMTHIIAYDYDCILKKYTELEFGNFKNKLSDLISNITGQAVKRVESEGEALKISLDSELEEKTGAIWEVLNGSYVIYEGDKLLIVDMLPKESARNVIKISNQGISFGSHGINGAFTKVWGIDGALDMSKAGVINLTADLIKGGVLKLGANFDNYGKAQVFDGANNLIAELSSSGLRVIGRDRSYVLINGNVGFAMFNRLNEKICWCDSDTFHMKKSASEEEITVCNKLKFLPVTITDANNNIVNDGVGLFSVVDS